MAKKALNGVLHHVRMLAAVQTDRALSDAELLQRFVAQYDEAAFTVLIERHGPMVLGVCQRALKHSQDAEDACQATFLVFARKAGSIRKTAALGSWLHGIACRICANVKRQQARRRQRERHAAAPAAQPTPVENWHEVQGILDEELEQLADRYRAPLLLCYWEGKTRDEAAELLGLTPGKLHGLLERGRSLLRDRLTGRGLTLSAALCASFLAAGAGSAALGPSLVVSCTNAAVLLAAGESLAAGIISNQVQVLTKEVLQAMFFTKLKIATASVLCAGMLATLIGGTLATTGLAQNPTAKAKPAEPTPAAKAESDEAFIRRISKDLRGVEPSPAEVHFFVNNKDAGRRQKLIDLFIQERQAAQREARAPLEIEVEWDHTKRFLQAIELLDKTYSKDKSKPDKAVDPLEAKRAQLEAQLKMLQDELAKLRDLAKKRADSLDKAKLSLPDKEDTVRFRALSRLALVNRPNVVSLQGDFFRSLIAAAKDKKDATTITQSYLDSLTKYIKDQPKAGDVPDAMLQIELVYRSLGKTVEANAWGEKLKKEHPNSAAARHRQSSLPTEGDFRVYFDFDGDGTIDLINGLVIPLKADPPPKAK